jgi:predicted ATPase
VEYGVLGRLCADDSGRDLTPTGARGRDLLAVLLLRRGQAVDPEVLLDLVWGPDPHGLGVAVVHTTVARLRRRLGPGSIETTGSGYRLVGDTDADRFTDLVTDARRVRGSDPAAAIGHLRAALALWRGERAYADARDDLVAGERPRLHELRDGAVELLAGLLLEGADPDGADQAAALVGGLLEREPLRESAHELAMLAAWRAGRQGEALAAYDRLRRVLRDELGIDPSPSATSLHARILALDPTLGDRRAAPHAPAGRPTPPAPVNTLVGRDDDLDRLEAVLAERRLVLLTGPGGVGKSRLLAEAHARVTRSGADTAYLDLGHLDAADVGVLAESLARMLRVRLPPGDPVAGLTDALATAELVLFVDEAERSAEAAAAVLGPLAVRCPRLRILVASRVDLELAGAARHVLAPLPCPAPGADLAATAGSPAVRLLRDRIADHAPDVAFTDGELRRLGGLARRVDGLPLALELLAGYAGTRTLAELDVVTEEPLELSSDEAGRPERHRSLRETVLWSTDRLPTGHREVLRRLGIFVGTFDLAAARAVVGPDVADVDTVVRSLVKDALVQVQRTPDGLDLRLLRTVRDLALDGLVEAGGLAAARARHRRWYAARWRGALRSDALLLDVRDHYVDHLEALRSALEDRDPGTVADLTVALARLWLFTDMLGPGLRWIARVLASDLTTPAETARIRTLRASLSFLHDPGSVRSEIAEVIPVLRVERDHPWLVTAHIIDALECSSSGRHEDAVQAGRRAVAESRHTTRERQADALGVLAVVELAVDPAGAAVSVDEAWALAQASGSAASAASVASNLALVLLGLDRATDARAMLEQAAADLGRGAVPLFLLVSLAWADLACGDARRSAAGFGFVVEASPDGPADRRAAELYAGVGCALAALGSPAAAEMLAGATALTREVDLTLLPWELELVGAAVASLPEVLPDVPGTALAIGHRLRDLTRSSTPAALDPPSWWPVT